MMSFVATQQTLHKRFVTPHELVQPSLAAWNFPRILIFFFLFLSQLFWNVENVNSLNTTFIFPQINRQILYLLLILSWIQISSGFFLIVYSILHPSFYCLFAYVHFLRHQINVIFVLTQWRNYPSKLFRKFAFKINIEERADDFKQVILRWELSFFIYIRIIDLI